MTYLFLLYADESTFPAPGSPELQAQLEAYGAFYELVSGKRRVQGRRPAAAVVERDDGERASRAAIDQLKARRSRAASRSSGSTCSRSVVTPRPSSWRPRSPRQRTGRVEARPILVI